MSQLFKVLSVFIVVISAQTSLNAQSDKDLYASSYANIVQQEGIVRILFPLQNAIVSFPNGTNQLNISVRIPDSIINPIPTELSDTIDIGYLLKLTVQIDPIQIQQELTSGKTFQTHGRLVLNSLVQNVAVSYMPFESGLEENGNFNVFISFRIYPADFNLANIGSQKSFVINLYNTKVNRF